jgi:periplasmic protein TonB
MFNVVAENRKRPFWSSRTIVASVTFHLLLLAGFVSADEPIERPLPTPPDSIVWYPVEPEQHVRADPTPPAQRPVDPRPASPATAPSSAADFPHEVPAEVPDVNRGAPATEPMVDAGDPWGTAVEFAGSAPVLPIAPAEPEGMLPRWKSVCAEDEVDTQPELANQRQAEIALQRAYPPRLRDGGVAGHTTVMLIVDEDGNVEPGSVQVRETTHDAFRDAAVRAVERFHFKPATLHGHPVAVLVTLPIAWELEN